MSGQHTPGPQWEAAPHTNPAMGFGIYAPDTSPHADPGELRVIADGLAPDDALLIVKCVNAHDELVTQFRTATQALGANATLLENLATGLDSTNKLRANELRATGRMLRWHADQARAAIAKATGSAA